MKTTTIYILSLSLVIVLCLTGCGKNSDKAVIINNLGEEEKLDSEELYTIYDTNYEKFKKYYEGAKITFNGTIESVYNFDESCYTYYGLDDIKNTRVSAYSDKSSCIELEFDEGFSLAIPSSIIDIEIAEINKGDKYHVESYIMDQYYDDEEEKSFITCYGIDEKSENKAVDFEKTIISKIK